MKKLLAIYFFTFPFLLSTDLCKAQIGINNTAANPDASAILDLNTGNAGVNKGFLAPQVALTDVTVAAPVTSPATGLMVYSTTAPAGGNGKGYYYWNGSTWVSLESTLGGSGTNNYVARWTPNANTLGTGMIRDNGSSVGINAAPSHAMLYTNSTRAAGDSAVGATYGVYGYSANANYGGVTGVNSGNTGAGVWGVDTSNNGIGVYGMGYQIGGEFSCTLANGYGVYGYATAYGGLFVATTGKAVVANGITRGGEFTASAGQGVYSNSTSAAGDSSIGKTNGVYGLSSNANGFGLYGTNSATGGVGVGAVGDTALTAYGNYNGIVAYATYDHAVTAICSQGFGVYSTGGVLGVEGIGGDNGGKFLGSSPYSSGVYCSGGAYGGYFVGKTGVFSVSFSAAADSSIGTTYGVYGLSSIKHGFGVFGTNSANGGVGVSASGDTALTAYGTRDGIKAYGSTYNGIEGYGANAGVYGSGANYGGRFIGTSGQGIYSSSSAAAGDSSVGVTYGGFFKGTSGPGVYSKSTTQAGDSSIGKTFGVYGSGAIGAEFTGTSYGLLVTNGFVGIGCTSPFYTLDVNGNIRASGSVYYGGTACSNAGTAYTKPDYVFEPDYKKTYSPLEVENFILKEGHLPWVTSAADDKKENSGAVDMTRMSFQTLEAVENTQMQIIEQQKTIVSQQTAIDKLNKQVADLTNSLTQLLNKQK